MPKIILIVALTYISNAFSHVYGPYKIGNSYKIQETQYTPAEQPNYYETGVASWYGNELEGKPTANGAIFKPDLYTAAHRTLPMPSVVLITNLTNNKRTIAVVNDRGPFSSDTTRIIDVSKKVAEKLDFANVGRANVKVEYVPDLSRKLKNNEDINIDEYNKMYEDVQKSRVTKVESSIDIGQQMASASAIGKTAFTKDYVKAMYVQIGAFQVLANAQKIYQQLSTVPKIQIRSESYDTKNYYIVRSGPFASIEEAESAKKEIEKQCKCQTMVVIL
jgi:rare lipoprotein A